MVLLIFSLEYGSSEIALQLIDFGQSIDLKLYPKGQVFRQRVSTKNFICTEMMDNKPWTFQTDLFCLAGTIHTILFGQYMEVMKKINGYEITTKMPRYFPKHVWDTVFNTLININDCNSMPNLQNLRTILLKAISEERERDVCDSINVFNSAINQR